jgi:hypothetical protein
VFFTKPLPLDIPEGTTADLVVVVDKVSSPCAFSNMMAISPTSFTVQALGSISFTLKMSFTLSANDLGRIASKNLNTEAGLVSGHVLSML